MANFNFNFKAEFFVYVFTQEGDAKNDAKNSNEKPLKVSLFFNAKKFKYIKTVKTIYFFSIFRAFFQFFFLVSFSNLTKSNGGGSY